MIIVNWIVHFAYSDKSGWYTLPVTVGDQEKRLIEMIRDGAGLLMDVEFIRARSLYDIVREENICED